MFVENNLKADPDNQGWVLGWAVVRDKPWHLVGIYLMVAPRRSGLVSQCWKQQKMIAIRAVRYLPV
ncbi:hypothetical protein L6X02_RS08095 [Escherichia coli]|nr:hypothetical protein [Escherichia coli]